MQPALSADISYPTDLGLLNRARVHTEKIIDILYKLLKGQIQKKPRTYRNLARKDYLLIAQQRRPSRQKKRQAIMKALNRKTTFGNGVSWRCRTK